MNDDETKSVVFTMGGKLIGRPECYEFLEDARDDIQAGYVHVILDMEKLVRINSTGVGILAALFTSARQKDGQIYIVNVVESVQRLLELAQLWPFLVVCESVNGALERAGAA
jgi:anti-anti-sigma factor